MPLSPSRTDCFPSRITPPAKSDGSSQWSITGRPSELQYSITWRISRAVATGLPSSLTATIPAFFIAAISASASPLLPTEAAPIGHTRTGDFAAARSTIPRVTEALSFTGDGIRHAANGRKSAARRRSRTRFDCFRQFLARLAQVAMKIDESGRDDQTRSVENFRVRRRKIRSHARNPLAIEQNIQCRVGLARRIQHPAILNQQHSIVPLRDAAHRPARRQLSGREAPCARRGRS